MCERERGRQAKTRTKSALQGDKQALRQTGKQTGRYKELRFCQFKIIQHVFLSTLKIFFCLKSL